MSKDPLRDVVATSDYVAMRNQSTCLIDYLGFVASAPYVAKMSIWQKKFSDRREADRPWRNSYHIGNLQFDGVLYANVGGRDSMALEIWTTITRRQSKSWKAEWNGILGELAFNAGRIELEPVTDGWQYPNMTAAFTSQRLTTGYTWSYGRNEDDTVVIRATSTTGERDTGRGWTSRWIGDRGGATLSHETTSDRVIGFVTHVPPCEGTVDVDVFYADWVWQQRWNSDADTDNTAKTMMRGKVKWKWIGPGIQVDDIIIQEPVAFPYDFVRSNFRPPNVLPERSAFIVQ